MHVWRNPAASAAKKFPCCLALEECTCLSHSSLATVFVHQVTDGFCSGEVIAWLVRVVKAVIFDI
jgi:hypothetical protein